MKPSGSLSHYHQFNRSRGNAIGMHDEARWLIGLISDSGMRLSEAAGLHKEDIVLDKKSPHIILRPHAWRRLKTKASERLIPLVGHSLWAVQRAVDNS